MKKIILTLTFLSILFFQNVYAQLEVGGGIAFGTEIEQPGINFRGYYSLSDQPLGPGYVRFGPGFTFFLPRKYTTTWFGTTTETTSTWFEINLDGNYVFGENQIKGYGLFGFNIGTISYKFEQTGAVVSSSSDSDTELGVNLGVGGMYELDNLSIFGEFKYIAGNFDQGVLAVGVLVKL